MKIRCFSCEQKLDVSDVEPLTQIPCPVCGATLSVPRLFGDLVLEREIGRSPLATVYFGQDITLDREVAVKVLNQAHIDAGVGNDFILAARAISNVNHPNLLPIYSCGLVDATPYLLMQHMPARGLDRRMRKSEAPLPVAQLVHWFKVTVEALAAAHARGILHYNITPANLLLDNEDNLKVADFGLSNLILPNRPLDPQHVGVIAQPPHAWYLAPERVTIGKQDLAMDMYALGATFYHACCGQPPCPGDSLQAVMQTRFSGLPPSPRELRPELPEALSNLLLALLKLDPAERPGDCREVYGGLLAIEKSLSTPVAPKRNAPPKRVLRTSGPARDDGGARKPVMTIPRERLQPPATVAPVEAPDALFKTALWMWRLIPLLIAIICFALLLGHITRADWYERNVRPMLPVSAPADQQDDGRQTPP